MVGLVTTAFKRLLHERTCKSEYGTADLQNATLKRRILPGSMMSGSQFWEIAGALTFIVGIAIVAYCLKT
jgi:hypothetical protein